MDEDHNQEAGFVTEEVNQVVKVCTADFQADLYQLVVAD